jgi:hypothetical protein
MPFLRAPKSPRQAKRQSARDVKQLDTQAALGHYGAQEGVAWPDELCRMNHENA